MTLPIFTTAEDVREVVRYLKNKPTGASLAEAKAALRSQVLDGRKVSGYVFWGFVGKEGEKLRLADRGWALARRPTDEASIFRSALQNILPYRSVLEWAFHQDLPEISNVDVAVHWHDHHGELLGTANENTIKDNAVCFFHLAQASGIGKLILGRKGQATRLVLDRIQLESVLQAGSESESRDEPIRGQEATPSMAGVVSAPASTAAEFPVLESSSQPQRPPMRVFIAHGKNMEVVDQIKTMLDLSEIQCEIAEAEETSAIPVPDKVFSAMRRCQAGIIAVTVDETKRDAGGRYVLNENILIEIGAAFVLYDRRVVLLWDRRLQVPSNLQGLYRCEFEGEELSWSAGMKLMKAIQSFKAPVQPAIVASR